MSPEELDPTEARRQRGRAIAELSRIVPKQSGLWTVPAQSGNGTYWVRVDGEHPTCTCDDFEERGQPCKHIFAVQFVIARDHPPDGAAAVAGSAAPTVLPPDQVIVRRVVAPKPTYPQVWPAYNAAQTNEKTKFQALLHDLCRGLEDPPQAAGRPRLPLRDVVFACAFKVYCAVSGRRFMGDLREAYRQGYISQPIHYNSISKYLEMPILTPILHGLIAESARPLSAVEVDFAVDSSGFSTSRFVRWYDHKYGKPMTKYDWVKVSLMCGVKTNVVSAALIDEKKGGDCPRFAPLFQATAAQFTVREASADAAYLSYENLELVARHGGTPFIAFKANTTAAEGGMFAKMYHFYQFQRDEFLSHYHKRSNAESTFSMIKAKFGDSLRSKTDTAMVNEALVKILCHNLCCLIQSHYELGIVALFWEEELSEPAHESTPDIMEDSMMAWAWI